jgi:U6 snRNA-associated Sm-like protein LSm7
MSKSDKNAEKDKKKREPILDLSKYVEKKIRVKFTGGREVVGTLKGFDQLINLVLDDTIEYLRDPNDPGRLTGETRELGICVCRSTAIILLCPNDGMEEIENPFAVAME